MINNGYYASASDNYEPESKRLRYEDSEAKENESPQTQVPKFSDFSQMNQQTHPSSMLQAGFATWGYNSMYPQYVQMNMQQQHHLQQQQLQQHYAHLQTSQALPVESNVSPMQMQALPLPPPQLTHSPDQTQNQTQNSDGSTSVLDDQDSTAEGSDIFSGANNMIATIDPNANISSNKIEFCQVPGRLSLLGGSKKLVVTLAEIQRRINPPECLNLSLLSAVLRKAKNKEGGAKLNRVLKHYDITIPQGRRKSAPNTMFTAFCEQEAVQLADDFGKLNERAFPARSIVYEYLVYLPSWESYKQMRQYAQMTLQFLKGFQTLLRHDPSPVMSLDLNRQTHFHNDTRDDFVHYSKLSHGFGVPGMINSNYTVIRLLTLMLEIKCPKQFALDLRRPVPTWAQYPDPNPMPEYKTDFNCNTLLNGIPTGNANMTMQHPRGFF